MAVRLLERNGFADFAHLNGGIDAWSQEIDPSVPRY
jgi:rhodanese-related sulfurtransferase